MGTCSVGLAGVISDRGSVQQFFAEAGQLVRQVTENAATLKGDLRIVHTLKGNCRQFGLDSMAEVCHQAENEMQDNQQPLDAPAREGIARRWQHLIALAPLALNEQPSNIEIDEDDLGRLIAGLEGRAPHHELVKLAQSWRLDSIALRFTRLAETAQNICDRLGKPHVVVHTDAGALRLERSRWAPFWAALVHAINNALDHGIEDPETRLARGKSPAGTLWLSAGRDTTEGRPGLTVCLRDDGAGLDWARLSAQAIARGLAHETREDLVEAMFMDGVSTREQVGCLSRRGVGMAALRYTTQALGGSLEVHSETGAGTTLRFRFDDSIEPADP